MPPQLYCMVLLHCPITSYIRRNPSNTYLDKSLRLPNLHTLPMHATAPPSSRVWFPRLSASRQRDIDLDERKLCQLPCRHAQHAFRLRICHWLYHDLSCRYFPEDVGERRGPERVDGKMLLLPHWLGLSVDDSDHYCGDGKSLLDGRFDGDFGCLCGVPMQRGFSCALTCRRPLAMGFTNGKADTKHWRAV